MLINQAISCLEFEREQSKKVILKMFSKSFSGNFNLGTVFTVPIMSAKSHSYIKTMPEKPKEDMSGKLLSPMPGTVISVDVQVGDMVAEGQTVAVVEAMKMQNGKISRE